MKEEVLRQIAEPDARMKKNSETQKRICQTSLSTVIWQSHTLCSLSEAHNSALVLTNYTFQCIKTNPKPNEWQQIGRTQEISNYCLFKNLPAVVL